MQPRQPPSPSLRLAFASPSPRLAALWMSPRPPLVVAQRFQRARDDKKSGWEPRRLYTMVEFMMVDKAQYQ